MENIGRHEELFGERTGPSAPDADLEPLLANLMPAPTTAVAAAAPDHGVTGDPPSQPLP
jgi:hypothetical protein